MSNNISEQDVRKVLAWVKHPMIDRSLLDLGIIKDIRVESDKIEITLAFPFPNIPIEEHLINSVREPITKLGAEVELRLTVMNQEELQKFLAMEQEAWKGGM
jgi:ATP-binding protein involved in chromosome partitioning